MEYLLIKWIHILSSTFLFGTGLGSVFYKFNADRGGNIQAIAQTNRTIVIADWIFTTPTVILQPLTGVLLARKAGYSLATPWLFASMILFVVAGLCWLPAVYLQIRMRNLSTNALNEQTSLDERYFRYARIWIGLGIPAFIAMVMVYFLMVFKPMI
jgi:uncharacterized membrane protein